MKGQQELPIDLRATIAWTEGTSDVAMHSWCGALVYWQRDYAPQLQDLGPCPACGRDDDWWGQTLPVGPFTPKIENIESELL